MNNKCEKILNQIYDHIDKQLSTEEEAAFKKHIEECESCKKELEETKSTIKIVNSLKLIEIPAPDINFSSEVISKIKKENAKNNVTRINFLKPIAAGIVILGVVAITVINFNPHQATISQKEDHNTVTEEYAEDFDALFYGEDYSLIAESGYPTDKYGLIEINGI